MCSFLSPPVRLLLLDLIAIRPLRVAHGLPHLVAQVPLPDLGNNFRIDRSKPELRAVAHVAILVIASIPIAPRFGFRLLWCPPFAAQHLLRCASSGQGRNMVTPGRPKEWSQEAKEEGTVVHAATDTKHTRDG